MKKYLIINADDFGISPSVNKAVIDLINKKKISSATLMPNAKYYDEAAKWSKENCKEIGLHITLVNGGTTELIKSMTKGNSLEDKNGYLFEDKFYFMKNFKFKELRKEIDSQFKKLIDDGIEFSHVDTHRYSIYPTYNPIAYMYLCKKCKEYKVPTRWCREGSYFVGEKVQNLCDSYPASKFFAGISDLYNVPIPDYVYKFPYKNVLPTYEDKKKAFIELLNNLPEGINEVHIHPSVDGEDIREITDTYKERIYEYELMLDEDINRIMMELGIELITYSEIRGIKECSSKIMSLYNILSYGIKYTVKLIKGKLKRRKRYA